MPDFGRWSGGGDPSLNEINRADRFIDALSTAQPVYSTDSAEAELAFLLADWRDDVRDAPITMPVTARDAADALHGGLSSGRRSRASLALVGSVAAALMCVGGFGAAVYGSGPGDSLYGMRSALFGTSEVTRDDQVSLASAQLQQVQQLIDQGQWQQAQDKLVEVSSAVQNVDAVQSKQDLVQQWNALTYKVVEQNPAATLPPGEPLPVLPSSPLTWLPVPVVEATTTSETTVTSETTTSGSATTSATTDSSVPSEVLPTPPPDGSTGPSATPSSGSAQTSPATSPSTSAPASTPTSAPASSPTSAAPAGPSTAQPSTTTAVTSAPSTTVARPAPPASVESPVASQPQLAPSNPKPPAPAGEPAESAPPAVPSQARVPAVTSTPQGGQSVSGGSAPVATTTVVPPR